MLRSLKPLRRAHAAIAVALSIAGYSFGCTLLTARTNGQCFNDGECRQRGASFAQTRCSATGTCESITLPEASADSGGGSCLVNKDCAAQAPARCLKGECVTLTNALCSAVDGDPTKDDAIFIGVMTPRSGVNQPAGVNYYAAATTANSEWTRSISGQPNTHPIVTIGCDELADPVGAASYLVNTIGVSAILGPQYDDDFEKAIPIAASRGTFLLSPRADDIKLPSISGSGKVAWSCAPNRSVQVGFFPPLMATVEAAVKAARGAPTSDAGDPIKVFFAVAADTSTTDFADAAEKVLVFNGQSALSNGGNGNYVRQQVLFDFSSKGKYEGIVASMISAAPDLVIIPQEYDLYDFIVAIETEWPGAQPMPRFLLLQDDPAVDQELIRAGNRLAGKVDFVTWTQTAAESQNEGSFKSAFSAAASQNPFPGATQMYDCFYETLYAFQSVLNKNGNVVEAIDTGSFSAAVKALNAPGTLTGVGGSGIISMLGLLGSGDADLDGTFGPLEFDTTRGSVVQDATLKCIKAGGVAAASGVTFNGATGAQSGVYSCL